MAAEVSRMASEGNVPRAVRRVLLRRASALRRRALEHRVAEKDGYFDPTTVQLWKQKYRELSPLLYQRQSMEMGLVAVVATQLWHHTFIDPTLASLPDWRSLAGIEADNRAADFSGTDAAAVAC